MIYVATICAYQRFMRWIFTLEEFGTNIKDIAIIYNIVSDTIIRLPLANINREQSSSMNDSCQANELLTFDNDEDDKVSFSISLPVLQWRQQQQQKIPKEFQGQSISSKRIEPKTRPWQCQVNLS